MAEPLAAELGLEVLDIELAGGGSRSLLRVYLDTAAGDGAVSIDDCEAVSRRLGDALDAHEAVPGHYMLEVSSPGLNRPLRRPEHFEKVVGQRVKIRLREPLEGRRNLLGRLESLTDGIAVVVDDAGTALQVALDSIERANLEWQFEEKKRPGRRR